MTTYYIVGLLLSDFPLFWSCFKKHTRGSIRQNEFTVKIGSRRPLMGKVPFTTKKKSTDSDIKCHSIRFYIYMISIGIRSFYKNFVP